MAKEGKAKVLTNEEFSRTIKLLTASKHAKRNIALLYCSFALGLRAKELAALRVEDVFNTATDKLNNVVQLKSAYTKGNKQRDVYLSNNKLRKAITDYWTSQGLLDTC